jgi:diguanylate cyclase (GGDEF)-like protein
MTREQNPIAIILCDIDYFKLYNDTYGHVAGDKCLKQVALRLSQSVNRPADLVARYGGEEFAVVMSNTDLDGAVQVAEKIKEEIGKLKIPHVQSQIGQHLSLSMGVGSIIPNKSDEPEVFINNVDQSLYRAKDAGRDRIIASVN